MEIFNFIGGSLLMLIMAWFCYMSFHVTEEQKKGKYIPLPWEEGGFLYALYQKFK